MAMPWSRAKQIRRALRGEGDFPEGYTGSRTVAELTALFDACFRIQAEASEAAGRHIPLVVENVRGAQEWVGRARWRFGSFYLWGDVPALMPMTGRAAKVQGFRFDGSGRSFQSASVEHVKVGGLDWSKWREPDYRTSGAAGCFRDSAITRANGTKHQASGRVWFDTGPAAVGSKSPARKMASAMIAKIPEPLARHIARVYRP